MKKILGILMLVFTPESYMITFFSEIPFLRYRFKSMFKNKLYLSHIIFNN